MDTQEMGLIRGKLTTKENVGEILWNAHQTRVCVGGQAREDEMLMNDVLYWYMNLLPEWMELQALGDVNSTI